ncbi:MAG TPA: hypothetical protein VFH42_05860, partial [Sporolactobacillaceae bacterium]|nr:hypothetical protein [Sporolactobacillaceae bacterium]
SALIYLFLTVSLGITMVIDFLHPFLGDFHDRLFAIHVTFGVLGWFTLLIMGFSFKLVPMFSLSHNYESKWASRSIGLLNLGLVCLTFGFLFATPLIKVIGCVLTPLSLLSYAKQMQLILKNRLRKRLDIGVKTALSAGPFTFIVLILAVVCALLCHQPFPLSALMYTTITGWIGVFILGFLFKIVPFLWWTFKYSSQIGHTSVPSLKDLTNEKRGKIWFVGFYILIFLNAMCLTFHFRTGIQWVQALIFLNTLLYAMDLVKVITFKPDQPAFTKN